MSGDIKTTVHMNSYVLFGVHTWVPPPRGFEFGVVRFFYQQPQGLVFTRIGAVRDAQSGDIMQLLHTSGELRQRLAAAIVEVITS